MSDPWKHRSEGMTCKTCMWGVIKVATSKPRTLPGPNDEIAGELPPPNQLGRCRRRAPTMNGYPAVFERDWCGDHKLDENKI